ncbi:MAG: DUF2271 domain-containing protein [Bacteroidales bacterium]|jgi:hypothetical protein|nr:DUF2271 domain-containing protein [Bacteroidales bacterium]
MNLFKYLKASIIATLLLVVSTFLQGQEVRTAGEVTLSFRTVTANGNYAPRHVLAVWVEDESGFVKSRLVRANNRKQYLYTWIAASNYNEVDAVTGSTISSHQTHTVVWDCLDLEGMEVPDGTYTVHIEFTEKHAQGPLYSIDFIKGTEEQHLTPFDLTNFKDIQLDFYPETTGVKINVLENEITIFPNPGNGLFTIEKLPSETKEVSIIDLSGRIIQTLKRNELLNNENLQLDLRNFSNGIYLFKIHINGEIITKKLIKS